jgi:5-methylcytosine-specific restriction protein B
MADGAFDLRPDEARLLLNVALMATGKNFFKSATKILAALEGFRPVAAELGDELLVGQEWLQEQADLLWERRQVIFYGPPDTGKTFLARELAAHLVHDVSAVKLVQFHPSYTYEDFFEGFRPVPRDDGQLAFALHPGPFRRLVDAAREHPGDPYVLIIDEINRANLAKVFGELYFLLEYRDQQIELLYSDAEFTLPENVFVIGTMNTADRSIRSLDIALRRRFDVFECPPSSDILRRWYAAPGHTSDLADLVGGFERLNADNGSIDGGKQSLPASGFFRASVTWRIPRS